MTSNTSNFEKGLNAYNKGDFATALKEWKTLAKQGFTKAQSHLGVMYVNGEGVTKDYKEALRLFTIASEKGDAKAKNGLGVMYDEGTGVNQDSKEAVKWFKHVAEQGYAQALTDLGKLYKEGNGVSQDYKEALRLFRLYSCCRRPDSKTTRRGKAWSVLLLPDERHGRRGG